MLIALFFEIRIIPGIFQSAGKFRQTGVCKHQFTLDALSQMTEHLTESESLIELIDMKKCIIVNCIK